MSNRMPDPDSDDWKTPEIRQAEAELDDAMVLADEVLRSAEELEERIRPTDPTATEEDIRLIEEQARRPDAPAELRALQRKVAAGELSWKDILEGRAYDDPDVRGALEANLSKMAGTYQAFEEGHTLDEVVEAERQSGQSGRGDDDDNGSTFLRHDSW